jgi:hypothetical protein
MHDPVDPIPLIQAEVDQRIAVFPESARLMRGYFDALRYAGFSEDQAFELTRDYHLEFSCTMINAEAGPE